MAVKRNKTDCQMRKANAKLVYFYCFGHNFNIAAKDSIKSLQSKVLKTTYKTASYLENLYLVI